MKASKSPTHKILFPIETTSRELLYKLFLSIKLADNKHKCYLGSKREIGNLFTKVSPFIYFDKGYHENVSIDYLYKPITEAGGSIFSLDEEGGLDFKDFHTINRRYPQEIFKYFSCIFLWGKVQDEFLSQNRKEYKKHNFLISGHPRFELLKEKFSALHFQNSDKLKSKYGKFYLFNMNTKYSNHIKGTDFIIENYGKRVKSIKDKIKYDQEKFSSIVSAVKKIAETLDCNVIIRPHPEENIDTYKSIFKNNDNVICKYDDNVIPWIIASEVLIHNDCTTAIEAAILKKPTIAYNKNINYELTPYQPIEVSHQISNENELIDVLKSGKYVDFLNNKNSIINDFFSISKDSTDIIIQEVNKQAKLMDNFTDKDINLKRSNIDKTYNFLKLIYNNTLRSSSKTILSRNKLGLFDNYEHVKDQFKILKENFFPKTRANLIKVKSNLYCINNVH